MNSAEVQEGAAAAVEGAAAAAEAAAAAANGASADGASPGVSRRGRERKASIKAKEAAESQIKASAAADAALKTVEADDSSPSKKKQKIAALDAPPEGPPMKRKYVNIILSRLNGSFGIALNANIVTEVKEGGAAAAEGSIRLGDVVLEVDGKDTAISGFAALLPKNKEAPIRLKLLRMVTAEAAAAEANEKASVKLQAALDAPDLAEGDETSTVENRRKSLTSAVSVATKAGLDSELIKKAQKKLDALPPPPEPAEKPVDNFLPPANMHVTRIKPPPSLPVEEEPEPPPAPYVPPSMMPGAYAPYGYAPPLMPQLQVPQGITPEQQAAMVAAHAAAMAAQTAAAAVYMQ